MTDPGAFPVIRDGLSLAGERWPGDGPVVVFLHAGVTDRRSWDAVAPRLSGPLSPVTYDRRGFGRTPVSPLPFPHVDDLLAVLARVAHLRELERPDRVGVPLRRARGGISGVRRTPRSPPRAVRRLPGDRSR